MEASLSSNQAKYETSNPVVQRMLSGFFRTLREIIAPLTPASVLDAGCGEGEGIARLADILPERVAAVDLEPSCVTQVRHRHPWVSASRASVTELPFGDDSFDLVLSLEVIEHIEDPGRAVRELARVAGRHLVVSVPHEPWFRVGSLLRGKYLSGLGNHPEHVNHFNRRSLRELLDQFVDVAEVRSAFPWLIASGVVRSPGAGGTRESRALSEWRA